MGQPGVEGEHLTLGPGEGEAGGDALGPGLVEEEGLGGAAPPQQPQGQPAGCPVLGGATKTYKGPGLGPGSIVYLGSNRTY